MTKTLPLSIDQISLSPDGLNLLLMVLPDNVQITVKHVVQLLQHKTFPKFKINIDGINEAIELHESLNSNNSHSENIDKTEGTNTSDELQNDNENNDLELEPIIIASKRDALLNIVIAEDNMSAYAEITTAYGGESITLSDVKERCTELGIKVGLLPKAILLLINTCKKHASGKTYRVNIANGIAPIDGVDSTFVKLVETDNHRKPVPVILDNGKVDMLNLGKTISLDINTLVMKQIPATEGIPGKTVTGEIIYQIKGIDHPFGDCKNVQVDPNNPHHLRSTSHGIPIDEGEFIRIDDILLLDDVSVKTGNVEYDGTVVITGDVHEGLEIKATGDITIMGVVESAKIYCGGDLTAKMPIIGRQKQDSSNFSCEIECKGKLIGTIAQYTRLTVGKDLLLDNQLMHCHTECNGAVLVYNESFKQGAIIGGITHASTNIVTTIVGTNAGNKTTIDLTGDYKKIFKEKKEQTILVQKADEALQQIKKAEVRANALLDPDDKKEAKQKIILDKQKRRDESDAAQNNLKETKHKLAHYFATTNLTATNILYSGVTILIGKHNCLSKHGHGSSTVSMTEKEITIASYKKE